MASSRTQVPDFIALRGDPSDKLPGARNVGAQGAADLLRRYGTLDALLKAGRFATPGEGAADVSRDRHDGQKGAAAVLA